MSASMCCSPGASRMKLSVSAKEQGISYKTAWRWRKAGTMPVPVEQLPSGTVIVHESKAISSGVGRLRRVFNRDREKDEAAPDDPLIVRCKRHEKHVGSSL